MKDLFALRGKWGQLPPIAAGIDAEGDCWLWTGRRNRDGYGEIDLPLDGGGTVSVRLHRLMWESLVGPIASGLEIDHLCKIRHCCNPDHLEPVTHLENLRRSWALRHSGRYEAAKTHCPQGHEYTAENTYRHGGSRYCRRCKFLVNQQRRLGRQ